MVLKKRLYYGFDGFQVPSFPRAPRSARGRGLSKRKFEANQVCAIELLASLAGKLLQESESSSASSNASEANDQPAVGNGIIKQEPDADNKLKTERFDQRSWQESIYIPGFPSQHSNKNCLSKKFPNAASDFMPEPSSIVTNSDSSERVSNDMKSMVDKSKVTDANFPGKVEGGCPDSVVGCVENGFSGCQGADGPGTIGLTTNSTCSSKDAVELCIKFPALINRDKNISSSSCRNPLRQKTDLKNSSRDDDKKFSSCNKPIAKPRALRPPSRIGDRRIRKLLTSKYWKKAPKLKGCELSRAALDGVTRPLYHKRKLIYTCERYQHGALCKKRKFSDQSLLVTSDGVFSSESVCNSPEKGTGGEKNGSVAMFNGANGVSTSVINHQSSFRRKDSHVKFSIKSFRIPELFIKLPETATVGSLKRTVMEAMTGIIGGGLRVGMLLHGKKIRDDNRTLLQTGITSEENLNTLGFTLEPSPMHCSPLESAEDPPALLPSNTSQPIPRSPASPVLDSGFSDMLPDPPSLTNSGNNIENNHESISSHTDMLTDITMPESKALVAVPPMSAKALAVVPVNRKARRSDFVQRRTRRPFSVSEVEALVHAVEELGTGRWRDVKLRSFENADHRTYVDLKDKWKTLVHTAKIAPQQRRGEPVPQELLDRVLAAHAYWSQHQTKQHAKKQAAILRITDAPIVNNGVEGVCPV